MRSIVLSILLCSSALADVKVNETTITGDMHGAVPRFSSLYQNKLIVAPGQVYNAPALTDVDAIEVAGIFRIPRDTPSIVRAINIQVLPGGSLDYGSETDPVLAPHQTIIKDAPLLCGTDGNLGPDPEQFGSGILVFGEWKSYGRKLNKTWTTMQPAQAGATTITLSDPVNWQAGDELLIPDTRLRYDLRYVGLDARLLRYESPVHIKAISGNVLTLDKPLDFEHLAAGEQLPFVANCTRNIVLRSENPSGTRGHAMFMDTAHVNVYYTSIIGFGRTLPKTLDNLDAHTGHVGTNQIARYAFHWHHVHGHADAQDYTGRLVGCYLDGDDIAKWGQVQHGTHDLLIADNVSQRFVGACFTSAEDGYEVRGKYLRNFAAHAKGNGVNGKFNILPFNAAEQTQNAPGAEGAGFWGHGSQSTFEGNVSVACAVGQSFVHINQVQGRSIPSQPGGMNDTPLDPMGTAPLSHARNIAVNCLTGLELWQTPPTWTAQDFTALDSSSMGVFMGNGNPGSVVLLNPQLTNSEAIPGTQSVGVHCSGAYTTSVVIRGGNIEGYDRGVGTSHYFEIAGTRFQNGGSNVNWADFQHYEKIGVLSNLNFEKLPLSRIQQNAFFPREPELFSAGLPISIGQGGSQPPHDSAFDFSKAVKYTAGGKSYWLVENFVAPVGALTLPEVVNAKAVLIGDAPLPPVEPPVDPPPVDPCEALKKQVAELQAQVITLQAAGTADAATISQLKAKIEAAKAALQ